MIKYSEASCIDLIYMIVNFGHSGKFIHEAKNSGIKGSTVMIGKGTVNNRISDYLGISDIRKEVILMLAHSTVAENALENINQHFKLDKPNHGIAFTTSISGILGTRCIKNEDENEKRGISQTMYHLLTVIVDKGKAEDVIDAAVSAGSKGGTIINARGSGIHETSKLFLMDIEPEKEIVLILSETGTTDAIAVAIKDKLNMEEPGNGMIFIQDVKKTYGIYK